MKRGHWMQIDLDLPEKVEVQAIIAQTGEKLETVIGRLVLFWRWVERHCETHLLRKCNASVLTVTLGGDEPFWYAVETVGWLRFTPDGVEIPGWSKRFSNSAKRRMLASSRVAKHRAQKEAQKRNGSVTPKRYLKKSNSNTPYSPPKGDMYHAAFELWWSLYPKRVGKQKAHKAWIAAGKRIRESGLSTEQAIAKLNEATEAFGISAVGQDKEFCPYPASWLNQARYDDDRSAWQRSDRGVPPERKTVYTEFDAMRQTDE